MSIEGNSTQEQTPSIDSEAPSIDFESAMQFIIDDRNESLTMFDQAIDDNEAMASEIAGIKAENKELERTVHKLQDMVKDSVKLATAYQELVKNYKAQTQQSETRERLIKTITKDLKAQKELTHKHKKSKDEQAKKAERLAKKLKDDRAKAVDDLPQWSIVYEVGYECLIVHPQIHRMDTGDGIMVEQATLLYTDKSGAYLTVCLSSEYEATFSSPLKQDNKLAEKTITTFHNNCIAPTDEVREFAQKWLYRVNVEQKGKVERADLVLFKG